MKELKNINLRRIFELILHMSLPKPAKIPIPIPTYAENEVYEEKYSDNLK